MFLFQQPLFLKAVLGSQQMTEESTGSFHIPPNVLQQPFRLLTSCTRVEHLLHNQQTSIVTQHPQFPLGLTLGVVCSMGFVHPTQRTYICHCSIIKSCFTTLTVILIKGETCSKLPFGRISSGSMANELKVAKSECRKLTQTRETLEIWVKILEGPWRDELKTNEERRPEQSLEWDSRKWPQGEGNWEFLDRVCPHSNQKFNELPVPESSTKAHCPLGFFMRIALCPLTEMSMTSSCLSGLNVCNIINFP